MAISLREIQHSNSSSTGVKTSQIPSPPSISHNMHATQESQGIGPLVSILPFFYICTKFKMAITI